MGMMQPQTFTPDSLRVHRLPKEEGANMGHQSHDPDTAFEGAIEGFWHDALVFGINQNDLRSHKAWDYVQIIPRIDYKRFYCGNTGAQAWRHRETGWTIPDSCRQSGGHPDVWTTSKQRQMDIHPESPVLQYIMYW